jgi:hypothetical protein
MFFVRWYTRRKKDAQGEEAAFYRGAHSSGSITIAIESFLYVSSDLRGLFSFNSHYRGTIHTANVWERLWLDIKTPGTIEEASLL